MVAQRRPLRQGVRYARNGRTAPVATERHALSFSSDLSPKHRSVGGEYVRVCTDVARDSTFPESVARDDDQLVRAHNGISGKDDARDSGIDHLLNDHRHLGERRARAVSQHVGDCTLAERRCPARPDTIYYIRSTDPEKRVEKSSER